MKRVFLVAQTEFLAIVRTKAFLIGILMTPVLLAASVGLQALSARQSDLEDLRFAVVDETGVLFGAIEAAAAAHNREAGSGDARSDPHFLPELVTPETAPRDAQRVALSDRVRAKELFAFVELPGSLVDVATAEADRIRYYTQTPSYNGLSNWIRTTVTREVTRRRLATRGIAADESDRLTRSTSITSLDLVARGPDGRVVDARRVDPIRVVAFPIASMVLLFVAVMSAAPPLLTSVVQEKASRISEVLISAIPPSHLMAGKLIGVAAVSVLLALVYMTAGTYALLSAGQFDLVRIPLMIWFVVFLLLAVLMYGSIFIMIGAACTSLEESQTLMQPVMTFLALPLMASPMVIRTPDAPLSVILSLVPTATPFLMLTRLAATPAPPAWQLALGLVLTASAMAACIFAAGRIFRIGLLMQGKPPNLPELLRWIRR